MFSFFWTKKTVDVRKERSNVSNLMLGVASITFFTLLAQIVLVNALAIAFAVVWGTDMTLSMTAQMFISSFTMYGVAMPLSMLFFDRCEVHPVEKKRGGLGLTLCVIPLCFALTYVGSIAGTLIETLTSALVGKEATNPVADTVSDISLWAVFLFMVVLAPIFEEIFFRKIVIDRLRRYGDLPAIVLSGVLFGVIHGNFSQFFYAALLGMVFGAVYLYTGKLRFTIFLHMLINFMGSFYTSLMMEKFGGEIPMEFTEEIIAKYPEGYAMMSAYSSVYSISFLLAIPALIYLIRVVRPRKGAVELDGGQRFRVVFCNIGFWLSVLFLLGNFALSVIPA